MSPPVNIIVGGGGDRIFRCAKRYADLFTLENPDRPVIYLPQGKRGTLLDLVNRHPGLNLIGHSWGTADVDWVLSKLDQHDDVSLAVGVDPVGKPSVRRGKNRVVPKETITIFATGSERPVIDGNLSARIGRWIGQECPATFSAEPCHVIEAPYAHYNMTAMMRQPGSDGLSAEEHLLKSH